MKKIFFNTGMLIAILFLVVLNCSNAQQNLTQPQASQKAKVMQQIGLTEVKVIYHSPLAKGRTIWGDVVPYNEVWRCGANENTVFSVSTEIMVEGKKLSAGSYGLHMIPTQSEWTIIFSNENTAWGSFFYDESKDALRVKVKPRAAAQQEWLSYQFMDNKPESIVLTLRWEKLEIPVRIEVNLHETVFASMKQELHGVAGFGWQGHYQAAKYCFDNNIYPDEAIKLVDKSIGNNPVFSNLNLKSQMLSKAGKQAEADELYKKAIASADENQLNSYGYELIGKKDLDKAIEIFRLNVKKYPNSWNVYDSLGEACMSKGLKKEAIENYKTALSKAPETQHKRINDQIQKIEKM